MTNTDPFDQYRRVGPIEPLVPPSCEVRHHAQAIESACNYDGQGKTREEDERGGMEALMFTLVFSALTLALVFIAFELFVHIG
jgi:hypothetical protein